MRALAAAVRRWPYRGHELVHQRVHTLVDDAAGGILVVPGHYLPRPAGERDRRDVVGDQGADLGVVEDDRVRLVAQ